MPVPEHLQATGPRYLPREDDGSAMTAPGSHGYEAPVIAIALVMTRAGTRRRAGSWWLYRVATRSAVWALLVPAATGHERANEPHGMDAGEIVG